MKDSNPSAGGPKKRRRNSFTLIEVLVATTVLAVLMLLIMSVLNQTQSSWSLSKSRVSQFRDARVAFELINRNLSQAMLNTYRDYLYPNGTNVPTGSEPPERYQRQSELQFLCGPTADASLLASRGSETEFPGHAIFFQAPLGYSENPLYKNLGNLLCARGYFVKFGDDSEDRPTFFNSLAGDVIPLKYRYRLYEFRPPTEKNYIYRNPGSGSSGTRWYDADEVYVYNDGVRGVRPSQSAKPIADNIVALIISPRMSKEDAEASGKEPYAIAPQYSFNSINKFSPGMAASRSDPEGIRHLLPPLVQVTLVAIDQASATRLSDEYGSSAPDPISSFFSGSYFEDVAKYEEDIFDLETMFNDNNINYRIFSDTISLRASKWDGKF